MYLRTNSNAASLIRSCSCPFRFFCRWHILRLGICRDFSNYYYSFLDIQSLQFILSLSYLSSQYSLTEKQKTFPQKRKKITYFKSKKYICMSSGIIKRNNTPYQEIYFFSLPYNFVLQPLKRKSEVLLNAVCLELSN